MKYGSLCAPAGEVRVITVTSSSAAASARMMVRAVMHFLPRKPDPLLPGSRLFLLSLGRLLLQILLPLAERGKAVHLGAMGEGALRGGDILSFALPGLLHSVL